MAYDGYNHSDVAKYEQLAGIAAPGPVLSDLLFGSATGAPLGNSVEAAADVELAIAMAPGLSSVQVFEGPSDHTACSYQDSILWEMAMSGILQFSTSFTCGFNLNNLQTLQNMAAQGQSFFYPSGDGGGYPANSEFGAGAAVVTVTGATTLTMNGNGISFASELPWVDTGQHLATGGGIEYLIPQPAYQAGTATQQNGGSTQYRNEPDVSIVGTNVVVVGTDPTPGTIFTFEGTSVSAPLWAGFMALVNQQNVTNSLPPAGFANPGIYAIAKANQASAFRDVASGNVPSYFNGGISYTAYPGYDLASGWGSPTCGLVDQLGCVKCGGTACVSFESDPNNCGGCGHSCGTGGCAEGQCQTAKVLATISPPPQGIALDASNAYFTDGIRAMKVAKNGGTPFVTLATGTGGISGLQPVPIAVDTSNVYWFSIGTIEQAPLAGGAATSFATGTNVASLASDGANVYWIDTGEVYDLAANSPGGATTQLAPATEPYGMAIDSANVYWTNTAVDALVKVAETGGGAPVTLATLPSNPLRIAVDGPTVYFFALQVGIASVPTAGGTVTTLTSAATNASSIAVDGTNVYWAAPGGVGSAAPGIYRVPVTGGTATLVAASQGSPAAVAVDGTSVYWTEADFPGSTGRVRAIAK
jgi:hypothetical protein